MRVSQVFYLVIAMGFSGCSTYTPPKEQKVINYANISKPYDVVWTNLIKFFSSKNISMKTIDKASGLIVIENMKIDRQQDHDVFDCGSHSNPNAVAAMGYSEFGKVGINVFVEKKAANLTLVTVNTDPKIYWGVEQRTETKCFSTGKFESMVFSWL